jgi:hypothetical protein
LIKYDRYRRKKGNIDISIKQKNKKIFLLLNNGSNQKQEQQQAPYIGGGDPTPTLCRPPMQYCTHFLVGNSFEGYNWE